MADLDLANQRAEESEEDERGRVEGERAADLKSILRQEMVKDPDRRAKDYEISRDTSTPVVLVEHNRDELAVQGQLNGLDMRAYMNLNPGTAKAISNVRWTGVAHDDLSNGNAHKMEQSAIDIMSPIPRAIAAIKGKTSTGFDALESNRVSFKKMWGQATEEELEAQKAFNLSQSFGPIDYGLPENPVAHAVLNSVLVAAESTLPSLVSTTKGKAVGGLLGFGAGMLTLNPRFAAKTAKFGAKAGGYLNTTAPMVGGLWEELGDIEGIDENSRKALALIGGGIGGFLEQKGFEAIAKGGFQRMLGNPAFKKAWTRIVAELVEAGFTEAITEGGQGLLEVGAIAFGMITKDKNLSEMEHVDWNGETHTGFAGAMIRVGEAMVRGFQGGIVTAGAFTAVGSAANKAAQVAKAIPAVRRQPQIEKLRDAIAESMTVKRDPEASKIKSRAEVEAGSAPKEVFISERGVREFFQDESEDPAQDGQINMEKGETLFGQISGLREGVNHALTHGTDLAVSYEDYVAYFSGSDLGSATAQDTRIDPRDMTGREADEFFASNASDFAGIAEQAAAAEGEGQAIEMVREELRQQLGKQYAPDQAADQADFFVSQIVTRAQRTGKSVQEMIEKEGLFTVDPYTGRTVSFGPSIQHRLGVERLRVEVKDVRAAKLGKRPEERGMAKHPMIDILKSLGGVDPESKLGKELLQIVPEKGKGSFKGLFVEGGLAEADQIEDTASFDLLVDNFNPDLIEGTSQASSRESVTNGQIWEAVGAEIAGDPFRTADEAATVGEARLARRNLLEAIEETGLSLDTATDKQIAEALLAFEESKAISATTSKPADPDGRRLDSEGGKQGSIFLTPNLVDVVVRFRNAANGTAMLHQGGHLWLAQLKLDAGEKGARVGIKRDWETVREWLGLEPGAEISNAQHKRFAKAVELYMMEGRAPSTNLESVFRRFTGWMVEAYGTLRNKYFENVDLNDDIRGVLDRMLATDKQIKQAAKDIGVGSRDGMLTAKRDGITELQEQGIREAMNEADREAENQNILMHRATARREASKEWKKLKAAAKAQATLDVDARREQQAIQWLRHAGKSNEGQEFPEVLDSIPPSKLSRNGVISAYGDKAILKLMNGGKFGLWKKWGGYHPDLVAEWFGFTNGSEMIRAMLDAGKRNTEIKKLTDERMREEHGEFANSATLDGLVAAAASNDKQIGALHRIEQTLAQLTGNRSVPLKAYQSAARDIIRSTTIENLNPRRYQAAALAEAQLAIEAHANGDHVAMQYHKQRQMMNLALDAEARVKSEKMNQIQQFAVRMGKRPAQEILGKAGKGFDTFQAQMNALLGRASFRDTFRSITQKQLLRDFGREWRSKDYEVRIPEMYLAENLTIPWQKMTVQQMEFFNDAISNIFHIAKQVVANDNALSESEKQENIQLILDEGNALDTDFTLKAKTDKEKRAKSLRGYLALIKRVEDITVRMGPETARLITDPIRKAQGEENILVEQFADPLSDEFQQLTKGKEAKYNELKSYPELATKNDPAGRYSLSDIIYIFLNVGNLSNSDKMMDGHGWDRNKFMAIAAQELSEADLDFIENSWKTMAKMWPMIVEHELRESGVAPPEIQGLTIRMPNGREISGEYWPVVFDPDQVNTLRHREGDPSTPEMPIANAPGNALFTQINNLQRAAVGHTHTQERDEYAVAPLLISMNVLPNHIKQVAHDLTHRSVVKKVYALVNDPEVVDMMLDKLGREEQSLFIPWLQDIAGDKNYDPHVMSLAMGVLRNLRTANTIFTLGGRLTTLAIQAVGNSNASQLGGENFGYKVWGRYHLAAMRHQLRHPTGHLEWVSELSTFMRFRTNNIERDLGDALNANRNSRISNMAMRSIGIVQMHTVDLPVWVAAFEAAQAEKGLSEERAVAFADSIVARSQGSGNIMDQSEVQRKNEFTKFLTMFFSYHGAVFNNWDEAKRKGMGIDTPEKATRALMSMVLLFMIPATASWLIGQANQELIQLLGGEDPDEDDNKLASLGAAVISEPLNMYPVIRNLQSAVAPAVIGEGVFFDPADPADRVIKFGKDLAVSTGKVARGEGDHDDVVRLLSNGARLAAIYKRLPLEYTIGLIEKISKEE